MGRDVFSSGEVSSVGVVFSGVPVLAGSVEVDVGAIKGVSEAVGCGVEQPTRSVNSMRVIVPIRRHFIIFLSFSQT